jgi:glutathione peroxidase-family protein
MKEVVMKLSGFRLFAGLALVPVALVGIALAMGGRKRAPGPAVTASSVYAFTANDIDGAPVPLERYRGQVLLIVNVASKCGFTPQYEGLQRLFATYQDSGLVILGFPANNFLSQEPGTDAQIKGFCSLSYGVTFPMFSKISVKGDDIHPLYAYLTGNPTTPELSGDISWNFNKFLVSRDGRVIARFGSRTKPDDAELVEAVQRALAQPAGTSPQQTQSE